MLKNRAIIRESAHHLAEAAEGTVAALLDERIEQEPVFTDRMLGRIDYAMSGYEIRGIRWTAKTLTDRGRGAQEKEYGADFLGVLELNLDGYVVKKGFLSQAKLIEPNSRISISEWDRMKEQCERMLKLSPSSFVFLYSSKGIYVIPAIAVLASSRINPHELYRRSIARFFEEHFASFLGDRRIHAAHVRELRKLLREYDSRQAIYLEASENPAPLFTALDEPEVLPSQTFNEFLRRATENIKSFESPNFPKSKLDPKKLRNRSDHE